MKKQPKYHYWSPAEIEKLVELIGDSPFREVCIAWNKWATQNHLATRGKDGIRKKAQALGYSLKCNGRWVRVGDVAALLGKNRSTIQRWHQKGWIYAHIAAHQTCVEREQLRKLAKQRPILFAGCKRDGLYELLEDMDLVDSLIEKYPERYQSSVGGKRVLWVDRGLIFGSYAAAGRAAYITPRSIRNSIRENRTTCGMRFVLLAPGQTIFNGGNHDMG